MNNSFRTPNRSKHPVQRCGMRALSIFSLFLIAFYSNAQETYEQARPRIIITADPELDDNNSLIRFLLYSSDVQIEGLIYKQAVSFIGKETVKERSGLFLVGV